MLQGLYTAQFQSPQSQDSGIGIVVVLDGTVLGGDEQYLYTGKMTDADGVIRAEISVRLWNHIPGRGSIFGGYNDFRLTLSGTASQDRISLKGTVSGKPAMQINVSLQRRASLPE